MNLVVADFWNNDKPLAREEPRGAPITHTVAGLAVLTRLRIPADISALRASEADIVLLAMLCEVVPRLE